MTKKIYHLNDLTMKYQAMAQSSLLHRYLGLPGEFRIRYPQEVILDNMDSGRMDELYLTDEDILINLEEESGHIGPETLSKYDKYHKFIRGKYNKKLYIFVMCHKDPKKKVELYYADPSTVIIIHYIYFTQEELWEKYDNIISKVEHKEKLTDMEAMDMAFIAKFIAGQYREYVVESIAGIFKDAIIEDWQLKMDVAVIINAMIIKTFESETKQKELGEMIGMPKYKTEMQKIVYEEYGEELIKKDKIIEEKDDEIDKIVKEKDEIVREKDDEIDKIVREKDEIVREKDDEIDKIVEENNNRDKELKKELKKLDKMGDLNPEAKKIISTLLLL